MTPVRKTAPRKMWALIREHLSEEEYLGFFASQELADQAMAVRPDRALLRVEGLLVHYDPPAQVQVHDYSAVVRADGTVYRERRVTAPPTWNYAHTDLLGGPVAHIGEDVRAKAVPGDTWITVMGLDPDRTLALYTTQLAALVAQRKETS